MVFIRIIIVGLDRKELIFSNSQTKVIWFSTNNCNDLATHSKYCFDSKLGTPKSNNCPVGYSIKQTNACSAKGQNSAVCQRKCCDGWQGSDCLTRM